MPETWVNALKNYDYPVNLTRYTNAPHFPGFFVMNIEGDRNSTILFENHYRESAPPNIPAYLEVIFWKLFSQPQIRNGTTMRIEKAINHNEVTANQLWGSVQNFIGDTTIGNLTKIRQMLGIKTHVLAVSLTLVSFSDPLRFPMVDKQVAKWVNNNYQTHNAGRDNHLTPFILNNTSLQDNDFQNYLNWVAWCREVAQLLSTQMPDNIEWRARDVEMAVFTAQRNNLALNVLG